MADPASLAQRAGELAGEAGALARNLDALSQQLALSTQQAAHAGTPFVFELTIFALAVFVIVDGQERAVEMAIRLIDETEVPHVAVAAAPRYRPRSAPWPG